eukprot:TRINITY_DN11231_c0_g1_i1.p1 TRINITY_DN11231_c0_g1~~TRINITY_DN11231_c0_g1_i1.p1  ORF type:complete len:224 (+),score=41.66 TRINITY_DN11231_c0_g1_i1:52-672(+)
MRVNDLSVKKMSLLSAIQDPCIIVNGEEVKPNGDKFDISLDTNIVYEVRKVSSNNSSNVSGGESKFIQTVSAEELKKKRKIRIPVDGRDILLIYHNRSYYAIDAVCYHFGGPLDLGSIEDLVGPEGKMTACIECPWHHYRINIENGDGVYVNNGALKSKGPRQRTHQVKEENESIFVKLDTNPTPFESDHYACQGLYKLHQKHKNS